MEGFDLQVVRVAFALYSLLLLVAVVTDVSRFIIPNTLNLAIFLLFIPTALLLPLEVDWLSHIGAALLVFAVCTVLFLFGWFGGGDVKLLTAVAFWTGFGYLPEMLMLVSMTGAALALLLMLLRRFVPLLPVFKAADGGMALPPVLVAGERLPYGVAIAAAAFVLAFRMPHLGLHI